MNLGHPIIKSKQARTNKDQKHDSGILRGDQECSSCPGQEGKRITTTHSWSKGVPRDLPYRNNYNFINYNLELYFSYLSMKAQLQLLR